MELPQGIMTAHGNSKDHVLKLERSIGFTPSLIDDCVFFRDDIIFMVYVDDGIFLGNDDSTLTDAIRDI